MRDVICFYTNCLGQGLIKLFQQHPALKDFEFIHCRPWLKEEPGEDQLKRCSLMFSQVSFSKASFFDALPASTRHFTLPVLACSVFWPYAFDRPDDPVGWRFPYGDRFLISCHKAGKSIEQSVSEYMQSDISSLVHVDRLLDFELKRLRQMDRSCNVQIAGFVADSLLTRRLFFTPDHPTDILLLEIANQILVQLSLPQFNSPNWERHVHMLQGVELPIHPSILRHLTLPFFDAGYAYPQWGGWLSYTAKEFYTWYAIALRRPSIEQGMEEAAQAISAGDYARVLNLCSLVRLREPHDQRALATSAVAFASLGKAREAGELIAQAFAQRTTEVRGM